MRIQPHMRLTQESRDPMSIGPRLGEDETIAPSPDEVAGPQRGKVVSLDEIRQRLFPSLKLSR